MTALLTAKLRKLSVTVAELKVRVREALAGELSKAIASAVGEVVHALVSGRQAPRPVVDPYRRSTSDHWDEETDRWENPRDPWDEDDSAYASDLPRRVSAAPPSTKPEPTLTTAVSAGVHVSRWWLARKGTLLAATGAGFTIGLIGLFGGTAAKLAVAVMAAAAELLSVADVLDAGAARLSDF